MGQLRYSTYDASGDVWTVRLENSPRNPRIYSVYRNGRRASIHTNATSAYSTLPGRNR